MTVKQTDLAGKVVSGHEQEDDDREDLTILKSVLQKNPKNAKIVFRLDRKNRGKKMFKAATV